MVNIIANTFGAVGAIVFVGFLAYKIEKLPLTIIVVVCLCLMVYSFYDDIRSERNNARIRANNAQIRADNAAKQ